MLATVLATKLSSPVRQAARLGERAWHEKLDKLRDAAAQLFLRYNGHLGSVGPEEIVGHFDGPARAVRCGITLQDHAKTLGVELAIGIHTGEIEIRDSGFAGLTVHVAENISGKARAGELLVSGVVSDLVSGSGLHFRERGGETIDGIPGEVRLLAVSDVVRHWSTVLNGMQVDLAAFKRETDTVPPAENFIDRRAGHNSIRWESIMDAKTNAVTGAALKRAIETRDGRALTNFYTEDAVLRIVDRNNPPSRPREVKGKGAIGTFWDDICSRAMTHKVETSVAEHVKLAFTQACAYPDGMKVLCLALCELKAGKIARQTIVQAWDE